MRFVVCALSLVGCVSMSDVPRASRAGDDSTTVYRWSRADAGRRVLVVPEVGFDHRLVRPLCERLQRAGFAVFAVSPDHSAGVEGFLVDVAAALRASRAEYLVALGVGGALAVRATEAAPVRGVVAINVPFAFEPSNVALADALVAFGFDPSAWARTDAGPMLLGAGRSTSSAAALAFEKLAIRPGDALRAEVAALYATRKSIEQPEVPLRLLVGVKDNLVEPHLALGLSAVRQGTPSRRMGLIEGFSRDLGHLEWLVDETLLDDVLPAIVHELEALP